MLERQSREYDSWLGDIINANLARTDSHTPSFSCKAAKQLLNQNTSSFKVEFVFIF
jgi:hypothetical protein